MQSQQTFWQVFWPFLRSRSLWLNAFVLGLCNLHLLCFFWQRTAEWYVLPLGFLVIFVVWSLTSLLVTGIIFISHKGSNHDVAQSGDGSVFG